MSQPRLYLDEDSMRKSLALGLRAWNVDVVTAAEAGLINRPDDDHLVTATSLERVLFTFNVADYCFLHHAWIAHGRSHSGIVVSAQQRYSVGEELRLRICFMPENSSVTCLTV